MTRIVPEGRERLQSRMLVALVGSLLVLQSAGTLRLAAAAVREFPGYAAGVVGISVLFAAVVRALRSATNGAAVCGGMICLTITYRTGWLSGPVWRNGLAPLACLFALTFAATRAGRRRKERDGLAEGRRGRSAAQVIANLGVAALCVSPPAEWLLRRWPGPGVVGFADVWVLAATKTVCLAALVEATADTMSSEVGQAFGGRPVLLAGLRRVAPGTDGAVSLVGTAAGIAGGAVVAGVGTWAMQMDGHAGFVALGAGVFGLFADSVLGATVERRGWLGNDLVNFLSTAIAAVVAGVAMRQ